MNTVMVETESVLSKACTYSRASPEMSPGIVTSMLVEGQKDRVS